MAGRAGDLFSQGCFDNQGHQRLFVLAWMISDVIIDFKLAKPRNKLNHEFHAQVGICADNRGNQISFDGSYNDSEIGLHNYEALKVFRSWDGTKSYVEQEEQLFVCIWNNDDPNIEVYDAPNVVKSHILELREANERPYPTPDWISFEFNRSYKLD